MKAISGTKEWANSSVNCVSGCSHDCEYCYAKSISIRFGRKTPDTWKEEQLQKPKSKKFGKRKGTVMFPTSHDITPNNVDHCLPLLKGLLTAKNKVLIVSKPHFSCIKTLCDELKEYQDQVLFRFTIGSLNSETLKFWEPGAPDVQERLEALRYAFKAGYATSISMEPTLDLDYEDTLAAVKIMEPFVTDAIWVGKANNLAARLSMNKVSSEIKEAGVKLVQSQNDSNIVCLYKNLKENPKIKWKESIKKVVGLKLPTEKGLDV